ncbi:hypothetical protein C5167_041960 [Papaver somniferum]|nr:hypothetical protein C5167_041960 [Papaver somniferum]
MEIPSENRYATRSAEQLGRLRVIQRKREAYDGNEYI